MLSAGLVGAEPPWWWSSWSEVWENQPIGEISKMADGQHSAFRFRSQPVGGAIDVKSIESSLLEMLNFGCLCTAQPAVHWEICSDQPERFVTNYDNHRSCLDDDGLDCNSVNSHPSGSENAPDSCGTVQFCVALYSNTLPRMSWSAENMVMSSGETHDGTMMKFCDVFIQSIADAALVAPSRVRLAHVDPLSHVDDQQDQSHHLAHLTQASESKVDEELGEGDDAEEKVDKCVKAEIDIGAGVLQFLEQDNAPSECEVMASTPEAPAEHDNEGHSNHSDGPSNSSSSSSSPHVIQFSVAIHSAEGAANDSALCIIEQRSAQQALESVIAEIANTESTLQRTLKPWTDGRPVRILCTESNI